MDKVTNGNLVTIIQVQMDDHDDNIFDEDDAFDYIHSEEIEKWDKQPQGKSGCLGILLVMVLPTFLLGWLAMSSLLTVK